MTFLLTTTASPGDFGPVSISGLEMVGDNRQSHLVLTGIKQIKWEDSPPSHAAMRCVLRPLSTRLESGTRVDMACAMHSTCVTLSQRKVEPRKYEGTISDPPRTPMKLLQLA